jgi:hypothetical protein
MVWEPMLMGTHRCRWNCRHGISGPGYNITWTFSTAIDSVPPGFTGSVPLTDFNFTVGPFTYTPADVTNNSSVVFFQNGQFFSAVITDRNGSTR